MRISRLFKRLRRWCSQAFRKRHSPAAFRTCRNAGNSVLTGEGTTSKGTGSVSCEVEFCIFYRLSLRTLRTKDVCVLHWSTSHISLNIWVYCHHVHGAICACWGQLSYTVQHKGVQHDSSAPNSFYMSILILTRTYPSRGSNFVFK
jgi:hypothetical protein